MTLASLINCLQPPQGEMKCSHKSLKEQKTLTMVLYYTESRLPNMELVKMVTDVIVLIYSH